MPTWSKQASKDLEKIPERLREKIVTMANRLDTEPSLGPKLKGSLQGLRSAHVGRSYRIIYEMSVDGPLVLTVRQRKDAYK